MKLNLEGKIALITGSGKGIGKEIARSLAGEGTNIILNDVNPLSLDQAEEELKKEFYVKVFKVLGNMAEEEEANRMFAAIKQEFGTLDILINNAAILIDKRFVEMSLLEWRRIFCNNLDSVFLASQQAVGLMKKDRGPVILNAGSFGGLIPAIGYSAYNASKAAIANLTRTMAAELNPLGIRVAGYIPGVVLTDIIKPMLEQEPQRLTGQIPLGRLANSTDIANAVTFLASEKADYVNGTMMEITGGKLCTQNIGR